MRKSAARLRARPSSLSLGATADPIELRIARKFWRELNTPLSLSLLEMADKGEWDAIAEVTPDPRKYHSVASYAADAAAAGLLRKFQDLPTSFDRRSNALQKWWEGERDCYRTNQRLARYLPEFRNHSDRHPVVEEFLSSARNLIRDWIGPSPDDLAVGRFGPGATFADKNGRTTVPDKMSSDPVMTRGAIWFLPQWLGTQWGAYQAQHRGKMTYVPGNRFTTVPKTSKTDRSIAAEPSINVFFQLALGRQLRSRLKKRACWDLSRAQELHRQVAESSSVTQEFATLDLSNASDTVCRNLVRLLIPPAWHDQLDGLRSPKTLVDGKWVVLEKFSSMGNGFTFELETIIFAALSVAATRKCGGGGWLGRDVYVFGDDIIVKNDVVTTLKPVLEFCGFTLNAEKSYFGAEQFRESCGGDYMAGKAVRPYFIKEPLNEPQDYIAAANGVHALTERLAFAGIPLSRGVWFALADCLPSQVRRCRGPQGLGDIVIHDVQSEWNTRWRSGIRYLQAYRPHRHRKVSFECFEPEVILACATYGTGNRQGGVIPRDSVLSHKVGWVAWS